MHVTKYLVAGLLLVASVAYAKGDRTDPNAIERAALMDMIGKNTGILGGMAQGKTPYDAAAAEAAKAVLIEASSKIGDTFMTQGAADPASEAKPEIWTNWDDFVKKAGALNAAASAADVSSAETIGASLGTIGGACKDCHSANRMN